MGDTDIQTVGTKGHRYSISSQATVANRLIKDLPAYNYVDLHPGSSIDTELVFDVDEDDTDLKLVIIGVVKVNLGAVNSGQVEQNSDVDTSAMDAASPPVAESEKPRGDLRTDLTVCEVELNETYRGTYLQWEGTVMDAPNGERFQVWWEHPDYIRDGINYTGKCRNAAFFVHYSGPEKIYAGDSVVVTGIVKDSAFEYAGGGGSRQYGVVVTADDIQILNKLN